MKRLCLAVLVMAACGGEDPSVFGEWRAVDNAFDPGGGIELGPDDWTFRDDGTLVLDGQEGSSFEVDGDRIRLTFDDGQSSAVLEGDFVVTHDRLLFASVRPDGAVDGAVGTWSGSSVVDGVTTSRTVTLDADGVATLVEDGDTDVGTWEEDGESIALQLSFEHHWFRLGEEGIGDVLLERVD